MRHLAARCVTVAAIFHAPAHECAQFTVIDMQRPRLAELDDVDPLLQQVPDLLAIGRHLVDRTPVYERDVPTREPLRHAGAIHRGVACTDHANSLADVGRMLVPCLPQE